MMSKKDLKEQIKIYLQVIKNSKQSITFAEKRIRQYKRELERLG